MNSRSFLHTSTRMRLATGAVALTAVMLVSGCAKPSASANVYNYNQTQRDQIVRNGTVINVRPITIQSDQTSGGGAIAGGAVGGVAGSAVGGGTGRTLAIIGGALLGALAGNAVEDQMGKKDGLEITVRLDNGETRVIAQEADLPIMMNQRVQVISGAGPTRVVPLSGS
ncbi:glycine zipper 2TM domain-containing protein [Zwartia vadi]|uniref:glycine zipper 2TM domain-containing protein n=1 Tax=Zwartia vadi TaxID=3058168 RepID=UPI0025B4367E|nr:glycine zipper 2TM domain-containing protein [Zwartia vadi]MDN3986183.1 glycine zipper 2TM domain-containing protein [Zwartia vadi]